jgi:hypothetical protein
MYIHTYNIGNENEEEEEKKKLSAMKRAISVVFDVEKDKVCV